MDFPEPLTPLIGVLGAGVGDLGKDHPRAVLLHQVAEARFFDRELCRHLALNHLRRGATSLALLNGHFKWNPIDRERWGLGLSTSVLYLNGDWIWSGAGRRNGISGSGCITCAV